MLQDRVIVLDERGKEATSEMFAEVIAKVSGGAFLVCLACKRKISPSWPRQIESTCIKALSLCREPPGRFPMIPPALSLFSYTMWLKVGWGRLSSRAQDVLSALALT